GWVNRAQLTLNTGEQRARVCLRADEQALGKRKELPHRSINLRFCGLRQIIGAAIGYNTNDFNLLVPSPKTPEFFPDRLGLGKVTPGNRLFDDAHPRRIAVIV